VRGFVVGGGVFGCCADRDCASLELCWVSSCLGRAGSGGKERVAHNRGSVACGNTCTDCLTLLPLLLCVTLQGDACAAEALPGFPRHAGSTGGSTVGSRAGGRRGDQLAAGGGPTVRVSACSPRHVQAPAACSTACL
jgi:hypothetical protein